MKVLDPAAWRALQVFAAYRLLLAALLLLLPFYHLPPDFLGRANPDLYLAISQFYLFIAVLFLLLSLRQWGDFYLLTPLQLMVDILLLAVVIESSGGLSTGLGSLLVVVVVAGGVLIPGRMAAFIAAIAAIALLIQSLYSQSLGDASTGYTHAGMLGATFFATALLAQLLSKKMQSSQALAEQRAQDVAKLATINQHIISQMRVGVLVINSAGLVTTLNQSARKMLGLNQQQTPFNFKATAPLLAEQLWRWQHNQPHPFIPIQLHPELPEILAKATRVDSGETLIYVEDTSAYTQQAQQLKLASLGRLTASIAHEIRNPLGAISHAGELLAESQGEQGNLAKLTSIIQRHSNRVNNIIETILQTSRKKTVDPTMVVLASWLEKLVHEYTEIKADSGVIELSIDAPLARAWIDAEQLQQVVGNLLDNAWEFADKHVTQPAIKIVLAEQQDEVIIDIIDNGPGLSDTVKQHLFEPFHSERQEGTGLGLYLARELCQANGARLSYLEEVPGCCFRISLPMQREESLE
jgi:two-component system sensor histidine kinase PilS (NtrC family)